jgi:hypothetical protein
MYLLPLFMAGIGSMTKPSRLAVEYRSNILEPIIGLGNIGVAHRLLDEVWRRANEGDKVDCRVLMRSKYPWLVLF